MKLLVGERYEVEFYDHSTGGAKDKPEVICRTIGYYIRESPLYFVFTSWEITNDDEAKLDNYELCKIFKKGVINVFKITRGRNPLR